MITISWPFIFLFLWSYIFILPSNYKNNISLVSPFMFPQFFLNPLIFSFQYSLHQDFSFFCDIQLLNQSLFSLYFIWPIAFKMLATSCFAETSLLLGLMTYFTLQSSPFQSIFRMLFFLELFLTQTFFMLYTRTVSYLIHIQ